MLAYALETPTVRKRNTKQLNIFRGRCIEEFWAQYVIKRRKIGGY
jgi:hypothetical protein